MKQQFIITLTIILLIATGCDYHVDYLITESVFIEDAENPGLPIYSEKGYNSFGVYWGLQPWITGRGHDPSKIVVKEDTCHIYLSGSIRDEIPYTLVFSLPDYIPADYSALISLNNKIFDLTGTDSSISLLMGDIPRKLEILDGEFHVKRAQYLHIDKKLQGSVLSGTFSFKATVDGNPATFSNGRFDMRFGEDNFYYMQQQ